jgi:hypothetical protein
MIREKTLMNKIINKRGEITTNTNEMRESFGTTLKTYIQLN